MMRLAAVGVMAAGIAGVGAPGAHAATAPTRTMGTTGTTTTAACLPSGHDGPWPAWAEGGPATDPGVRVWHSADGWHVRVTHSTMHDRVFAGEILTTGRIVGATPVKLEKNDAFTVGPRQHGLVFRFNNYGGVDGFDFTTTCAPFLEFGFASDAHLVGPSRISIGAGGRHPAHDPFVIRRTA
jgi:hypothetical protein